tara:strand:- start:4243 stop:4566 length:324 start_codon:yes stop_codon:yes gene_type:complete
MMKKKLDFSVLFNNENLEIEFKLNENTVDIKNIGLLVEKLLNIIDQSIKDNKGLSEGDVFQAISVVSAIRIGISKFDNKKLSDFSKRMIDSGIVDFNNAKKTKIGRA